MVSQAAGISKRVGCFICLLAGLISTALADTHDLEQFLEELNQLKITLTPPPVPQLNAGFFNYSLPIENNIFDSARTNHLDNGVLRQHYNLKQLQMVGYMHYLNVDYAFLKTPFETLKVKAGDTIQSGKVLKITATSVEIINPEIEEDKLYNGKIFIQLKQAKTQTFPKLPSK